MQHPYLRKDSSRHWKRKTHFWNKTVVRFFSRKMNTGRGWASLTQQQQHLQQHHLQQQHLQQQQVPSDIKTCNCSLSNFCSDVFWSHLLNNLIKIHLFSLLFCTWDMTFWIFRLLVARCCVCCNSALLVSWSKNSLFCTWDMTFWIFRPPAL